MGRIIYDDGGMTLDKLFRMLYLGENTLRGKKKNKCKKPYDIPILPDIDIFIGDDIGSHSSPRIKAARSGGDNKQVNFRDRNRCYEIYEDKGEMKWKGGNIPRKYKLSDKEKNDINEFYNRNRDLISKIKYDSKNADKYICKIVEKEGGILP